MLRASVSVNILHKIVHFACHLEFIKFYICSIITITTIPYQQQQHLAKKSVCITFTHIFIVLFVFIFQIEYLKAKEMEWPKTLTEFGYAFNGRSQ